MWWWILILMQTHASWAMPEPWRVLLEQESELESQGLRAKNLAATPKYTDAVQYAASQRALQGRLLAIRLELLASLQSVSPHGQSEIRTRQEIRRRLFRLLVPQIQRMQVQVSLRIARDAQLEQERASLRAKMTEDERRLNSWLHSPAAREDRRKHHVRIFATRVERLQDRLLELRDGSAESYLQDQEWEAFVQERGNRGDDDASRVNTLIERRRYLVDLHGALTKTACSEVLQ